MWHSLTGCATLDVSLDVRMAQQTPDKRLNDLAEADNRLLHFLQSLQASWSLCALWPFLGHFVPCEQGANVRTLVATRSVYAAETMHLQAKESVKVSLSRRGAQLPQVACLASPVTFLRIMPKAVSYVCNCFLWMLRSGSLCRLPTR